jgi:cytochrome c553
MKMKKIILIATLLVFAGCSSDESKKEIKTEVKKETVKEVKKEVIVVKKTEAVKPKPVPQIEELPKEVKIVPVAKTGKELFKACVGCHGANGEKVALGKSKIIQGWDTQKIQSALNGYKDGTYGGTMKGVMKNQANSLSDTEIKVVAAYISKL